MASWLSRDKTKTNRGISVEVSKAIKDHWGKLIYLHHSERKLNEFITALD